MLLMIDNYDSFTYNLVQYFAELGEDVRVLRNDEVDVAGIGALKPDRLVLSPGPCSPAEAGVCVAAIDAFAGRLPILGVCLGHQAIGAALGGRIVRAKTQMHGKTDVVTTDRRGVYRDLPGRFTVTRYHSLVIDRETLPAVLEVTSTSEDGEIMGVRHRELAGTGAPLEGVQFHPESILTEHGHAMLKNFLTAGGRGMTTVDLRSDTVTRPTPAMREAMLAAPVGDDVFGDDPTVNALQDRIAALLGKEAALFVPTGTQSNLVGIMSHCGRGDEYIVGQMAHTYRWEGGGAAVLGSVQPQPLVHQADGSIALDEIEAAIKPDDAHFARTRLLTLENTIGGKVLPATYLAAARALAERRGLATHLDGARLFNAAVAGGVPAADIARHFDSVSVCFSKGLGAPVGSALVGSREFIGRAHRWRKMLGGGMRQTGVLAAGALHALDHHVDRLADDHRRAARLAAGLGTIAGVRVAEAPQTNIVFVDVTGDGAATLVPHLKAHGVLATGSLYGTSQRLRFVTHLDVDDAGIDHAVATVREHLTGSRP